MDIRLTFIVAQQDVIARLMLLDQNAFQQQRFGFGMGNRHLDRADMGDQARVFAEPWFSRK